MLPAVLSKEPVCVYSIMDFGMGLLMVFMDL